MTAVFILPKHSLTNYNQAVCVSYPVDVSHGGKNGYTEENEKEINPVNPEKGYSDQEKIVR